MRMSASSVSNRNSASALVSSVLPTPVGPRNRKEPFGRFGSASPARERRIASDTVRTASAWPTTRLPIACSILRSFSRSPSSILETGMPVHFETTSAISSSPTLLRRSCGAFDLRLVGVREALFELRDRPRAAARRRARGRRRGRPPRRPDLRALELLLDVRGALLRRLLGFPDLPRGPRTRRSSPESDSSSCSRRFFEASSFSFLSASRSILSWMMRRSSRSMRLGLRVDLHADARGRLVDEVDRLVGQLAVADVAVRERRGGDDRGIGDVDVVMDLVAFLQAAQDRDRVLDRGLVHQHLLEAALERGVLFDVLAVFVERGRADAVQLAARERGLQHVAGVHRALGLAGADHRVQLVDEEDDLAFLLREVVQHALQALLELAAELRAGDQRAHVEREDALVLEALRHLAVHDALREPLDDRGLADARLADQHGIVLGAPLQHLDRAADLVVAADHRIELALLGARRQVES